MNTGMEARNVLMLSLLLLTHILKERATKVEYIRTLSIALLAWTKWMDTLPACCFNEESCEALLSRMASSVRSSPTLSSFESVSDLFITLPPPSRALKCTRGRLREGLLQLFVVRCRKVLANGAANPFVEWKQKGAKFVSKIPDDFAFPGEIELDVEILDSVFDNSLRCLRSKNRHSEEVEEFLDENLPKSSPDDMEEVIPRRAPKRTRRDQATSSNTIEVQIDLPEEEEEEVKSANEADNDDDDDELGSLADIIDVDALSDTSPPVVFYDEAFELGAEFIDN